MQTSTEIRAYVEAHPQLVNVSRSTRYSGLSVLKYKKKVFFDSLWTPELEELRGLVVDENYNPVARPFRKIYNYNENEVTLSEDEDVIAVEKVNGFMAALTHVEGHGVVLSTTGSLDSPFVELAWKHVPERLVGWIEEQGHNWTYLFEVCDQINDPHIIQETQGLHLVGVRHVQTGEMKSQFDLDVLQVETWGMYNGIVTRRPRWNETKFGQVLHWAKYSQHEGYVVYGRDVTLKLKTPYYLTLKFLTRAKKERLEHVLENRQRIDEEYYPLLDHVKANQEQFNSLDQQGKIQFCRDFFYL